MRNFTLRAALPIMLCLLSIQLCATDIGGTITSNLTLIAADSPYNLTEDLIVPDGFTLTIAPGVEIDLSNFDRDIIIEGSLIADGTANDSISFFSSAGLGGGSIQLKASANIHSISYCQFDRLGTFSSSAYRTAVYLEDTNLELDHCSFTNCGTNGTQHMLAHASAISDLGPSNSIDIVQLIDSTLIRSCTWPMIDSDGFSYRLYSDQINAIGQTLLIEPGVTIDLSNQAIDLKNEGTLLASGSAAQPIEFTSSGGLNGGSLDLLANSSTVLEYVEFSKLGTFSGSAHDTGLYLEEASLSMNNCSFDNCGSAGLRHITADASAISDIGPDNSIERIRLIDNTLDNSCTWPNMDLNGCIIESFGDQTLEAGHQLTIQPGVEIELLNQYSDLHVNGTLIAIGLASSPIRFYSSFSLGGGSIALLDNSVAQLNYLNFEKLGTFAGSEHDTGLHIENATVTADHLNFENCGSSGTRHIVAYQDVLSNFGPNNTLEDVILVDVIGDQQATWPNLDSNGFRYVLEQSISLDEDIALTIEAGTEILLSNQSIDLIINGSLMAEGTSQDSIRFHSTSSLGGGSLVFGSSSTGNILKYCAIHDLGRFSGSLYDAGVQTETGDLVIEKSTIRNCKWGIHVLSGQPTIANNIIKDNYSYGLLNEVSNGDVTACDNYWGDPSGPYNPTSNASGLGDRVSDNVLAIDCDADPLVIVCPNDTTLFVGDSSLPALIGVVELCLRDCGMASSSFSDDIPAPQCSVDMARTWSVTDTCGWTKTCIQTISWIDNIAPSATCLPSETLECNTAPPAIDLGQVVATDNCNQALTTTFEGETSSSIDCLYNYERIYKVVDAAGNSATCTTDYYVTLDTEAPQIIGAPDDLTVLCGEVPVAPSLSTTDDCSAVTLDYDEVTDGECPTTVTRTWVATDDCGNSSIAVQVIMVEAPAPECPADINADGFVNTQDFIELNSAFNTSCTDCPEDITQDGLVNIDDFLEFNSAYGTACDDELAQFGNPSPNTLSSALRSAISEYGISNLNPDLAKYLSELEGEIMLNLFPVPSDGIQLGLQIKGLSIRSDESLIYHIYDLTGKCVSSGGLQTAAGRVQRINFDNQLVSGMYTIQITIGDKMLAERFSVE